MKLSKENAARQRALQKAIVSGKTLGGLLVGLTAATVVGGCKDPSPARTMGSYPRPQQQASATSENAGEFVTQGVIAVPKPKTPQPTPNAVRERRGKEIVLSGDVPPPLEAQLTFRTAGVIMSQLSPTNKTPKVHLNKGNSKKLKGNSKENDVKVEVDL